MKEIENNVEMGWLVKTKGPIRTNQYNHGHIFSGTREYFKQITFPICPACNQENSPIMYIDCSDSRLNNINLWNNNIICIQCHNGCGLKGKYGSPNYCWDYSNPNSPKIMNGNEPENIEGRVPKNWEFEGVEVELIPKVQRTRYRIELETRIGGEPTWIHNPLENKISIHCIICNNPMKMLFQWSETNMDYIPRGIRETAGAIMGNPGINIWYGCKDCKIMAQVVEVG